MPSHPSVLTPMQRRIRAAAMSAGKNLGDLAEAITERGMSEKRIGSIGGRGVKDAKPTDERLQLIAKECGCPVEFLRHGWAGVVGVDEDGKPTGFDQAVDAVVRVKLATALEAERNRRPRPEPGAQSG